MTPLILISLLSIGLIGLVFNTYSDDSDDDDRTEKPISDEMESNKADPVLFPSTSHEGIDDGVESPNLPDDKNLDQSNSKEDVFIALSENTSVSGNTLSGGSGDDFIRTSQLPDYDGNTTLNWFATHLGAGGNLVFGGAGDDTIEISKGDIALGDAGDDTFIIVVDPIAIDPDEGIAEVHDFEQNNDIIFVQLPPVEMENADQQSENSILNKIELNFDSESTQLSFDGRILLSIKGSHNLSVGVQEDGSRNVPISDIHNFLDIRGLGLVDLDGVQLTGDRPDIIVSRYTGL